NTSKSLLPLWPVERYHSAARFDSPPRKKAVTEAETQLDPEQPQIQVDEPSSPSTASFDDRHLHSLSRTYSPPVLRTRTREPTAPISPSSLPDTPTASQKRRKKGKGKSKAPPSPNIRDYDLEDLEGAVAATMGAADSAPHSFISLWPPCPLRARACHSLWPHGDWILGLGPQLNFAPLVGPSLASHHKRQLLDVDEYDKET
ncbi:hypothetical protein B0H10DRAFT_1975111, partial [Mycena sp. CBHHK59/15]